MKACMQMYNSNDIINLIIIIYNMYSSNDIGLCMFNIYLCIIYMHNIYLINTRL